MRQHTIRKSVSIEGVGLHSGKVARVTVSPAPADAGVVFKVRSTGERIPARPESVVNSHYATTLGVNGTRIQTVEHLMAAAAGLGIDNVEIEVDGPEIPALDGSAKPFVALLAFAGRLQQSARRRPLTLPVPASGRQRRPMDSHCSRGDAPDHLHPGQRPPGDRDPGPLLVTDRAIVRRGVRSGADVRLPARPRDHAEERPRARRLARQRDRARQQRRAERPSLPRRVRAPQDSRSARGSGAARPSGRRPRHRTQRRPRAQPRGRASDPARRRVRAHGRRRRPPPQSPTRRRETPRAEKAWFRPPVSPRSSRRVRRPCCLGFATPVSSFATL